MNTNGCVSKTCMLVSLKSTSQKVQFQNAKPNDPRMNFFVGPLNFKRCSLAFLQMRFLFQKSSSSRLTYSADRAVVASKKMLLLMVPQRVAFSSQEDLHDQVHESSTSCPLFSTVSGLC